MGLRDSGLGPEADTLLSPGSQLCDHSQVLASKVVFLFVCLFFFCKTREVLLIQIQ